MISIKRMTIRYFIFFLFAIVFTSLFTLNINASSDSIDYTTSNQDDLAEFPTQVEIKSEAQSFEIDLFSLELLIDLPQHIIDNDSESETLSQYSSNGLTQVSYITTNKVYLQNSIPVGVVETYMSYTVGSTNSSNTIKLVAFGHRFVSYESIFGSPVSMISIARSSGSGTSGATNYLSVYEESSPLSKYSGFFTLQSANTNFVYSIIDPLGVIGVETKVTWRNKNGSLISFTVHTHILEGTSLI